MQRLCPGEGNGSYNRLEDLRYCRDGKAASKGGKVCEVANIIQLSSL